MDDGSSGPSSFGGPGWAVDRPGIATVGSEDPGAGPPEPGGRPTAMPIPSSAPGEAVAPAPAVGPSVGAGAPRPRGPPRMSGLATATSSALTPIASAPPRTA